MKKEKNLGLSRGSREYKKTKDTSQYIEKIRTGTTKTELEHHGRPQSSS